MESGFINSQPSMAEFMTALPHINESFRGASSINGAATVTPAPPQSQQRGAVPESPPEQAPKHAAAANGYSAGVAVPEYPWMKEKKTTRKQQQGRNPLFNFLSTRHEPPRRKNNQRRNTFSPGAERNVLAPEVKKCSVQKVFSLVLHKFHLSNSVFCSEYGIRQYNSACDLCL